MIASDIERDLFRIFVTIYFKLVLNTNILGILHNIGQYFGHYSYYFGSYASFDYVNGVRLVGIKITFSDSTEKNLVLSNPENELQSTNLHF